MSKMKIYRSAGLLLLALVLLGACTDFLEIKPYGRTIPKTAEEFSALMHTHLNDIDQGTDEYIVGNASRVLDADVAWGDDFETCLTESNGRTLGIYVGSFVGGVGAEYNYSRIYQTIRDCNIVIGEMEESGTELADKTRATAYALRAVCYYQLLRLYCMPYDASRADEEQSGLPLVETFDMEERPLRATMAQTVLRIETDLKESLQLKMTDPLYLFTEDVVRGYLARLYFWTGQWGQALALAQELLEKYPLLEGEAYRKMMTTSSDLAGNQLLKAYRTASSSSSSDPTRITIQYRPVSKRFVDLFDPAERDRDVRYALWMSRQRKATKVFFCGMRAAEFKLIEAECYYHLNEPEKALASINDLRAHRITDCEALRMDNLPPVLDSELIRTDATGEPLTPLLALILRERRKELFLEMDRFFELKRNGSPEFWTAYNGQKYTTLPFMYTAPIPARELDIIPALKQNPGYRDLISN